MNIRVNDLTKILSHTEVLSHINLSMSSEKVYGLQGINGCGKTMLMRAIAGLIHPTEGEVIVDGNILGGQASFPKNMGLLLENPVFLDQYTGLANLRLLARIRNRIGLDAIRESLSRVGLDPDDRKEYRKYSLGMKQRLGIACAVMEKPDLILLDEPFISLDEEGIRLVTGIIREEKERGALVILSSHDHEIMQDVADEIIHLTAGKITGQYSRLPQRDNYEENA